MLMFDTFIKLDCRSVENVILNQRSPLIVLTKPRCALYIICRINPALTSIVATRSAGILLVS